MSVKRRLARQSELAEKKQYSKHRRKKILEQRIINEQFALEEKKRKQANPQLITNVEQLRHAMLFGAIVTAYIQTPAEVETLARSRAESQGF